MTISRNLTFLVFTDKLEYFFRDIQFTGLTKIFFKAREGTNEKAYEAEYLFQDIKDGHFIYRLVTGMLVEELLPIDCERANQVAIQIFFKKLRPSGLKGHKYCWYALRVDKHNSFYQYILKSSLTDLRPLVEASQRDGRWDPITYRQPFRTEEKNEPNE